MIRQGQNFPKWWNSGLACCSQSVDFP